MDQRQDLIFHRPGEHWAVLQDKRPAQGIRGAYAGLGYGSALTLWEDSSGKWARVADRSPKGLLFELGSICNMGRLNLSSSY